ncbi:MAG: iron-sulfur cluster assembly scaffold protein [Pseudomonadota bacterium]
MSWDYSEKVKELFLKAVSNPADSHMGEIADADGMGQFGSLACGDAIMFYFKTQAHPTDPFQDQIIKAKYKTFGCTSAIAASEALCLIIEDKKPTALEALKITNKQIVDFLGGMPAQKIHCSVMGQEVLKIAVEDWAKKRGVSLKENQHFGEAILCQCFQLTRNFVESKIKEMKLQSVEEVKHSLKAGSGCGHCLEGPQGIKQMLKDTWGEQTNKVASCCSGLPPEKELLQMVEEVLQKEVRPKIGDVDVTEIKGHRLYCYLGYMVEREVVEKILRDHIDSRLVVIDL